ncbi:AAA family ATPase [Fusobacterium necrophorum]|uniref:Uncharacterized AAA domain-containing protein ycf46 n=2 Tax=Fusobacterium necrophorum TaxID=859 RepID=A0AB73BVA7_9FUSO|nr:SUMF1/EgtB/PvdO family nonheme iron enzyme [Fusobacterium necrophorum]AYZ73302.1 AAA family ATPase [Fusobacterium necrophorum]AZW08699.1 AAA family ATPase [Fusobacterium necrophorum subsp. necrophorum]KDE62507.1 ATPase [Fusobacterium necrophorum BL]KDE64349.1 ATPase [Fusobacterium necrophorum DJ-1]KDE67158.1 ATPase AAA [Fusobacterium necrophorum BFTR-1]
MENQITKYIRAKRPILWITSSDYKEVDTLITEATKEYENRAIYEYRALGAVNFNTKENSDSIKQLYQMLDILYSEGMKKDIFLLIKSADEEVKKAENLAYIKKIAELRCAKPDYHFTTIIVSERTEVPKEIEKFTSVLEIPTMRKEEIENYIQEFSKINQVKVNKEDLGEIAISLKGLTKLEIDHVLNMMIENKKNISISDRNIIIKEKGQIIKKSAVLEIIDFKEKMDDIGGLEGLKEWLDVKAQVFRRLDEAQKFGVDIPKGVLLVGMPGCGKSLAAKASARKFNVPLLRLDIGRLLGKYVRESEHNMRVALKTAESISPCILWIDEIEKAFMGIDRRNGASDITKRLFGQFLTWLQEKENTVFVVATANDITMFPPEFLRKGRFDEIFFVDFPNQEERERIFEIHLEKRGQSIDEIDIEKLAKETEGYCGADIEEIVKFAVERLFIAKAKEGREENILNTQDLLDAKKNIDSLSNIMKDKITILKQGYEKFKIKSATAKLLATTRMRQKIIRKGTVSKNKDMVFVQGGKYKASFFEEEREVFDMEVCKYQTTQDMWVAVMGTNPSHFKGGRLPVEKVSWRMALEYCNALSEKEGYQPVYDLEGEGVKIWQLGESKSVYPNLADFKKTEGYRLPTELEWEWFAGGGEIAIQDGSFDTKYAGSNNIAEVAWYKDNSYSRTHDVGTKKPNELGLYDCSGNVWEWCYDTAISGYISEERAYIYDESEKNRRLRGGSWYSYDCDYSISSRDYRGFSDTYNYIGFRVVRTV